MRTKLTLPKVNDNRHKPENLELEKIGEIHNAATNTLHINDEIDSWFGISADDVKNALSELDDSQPLRVVIDSPGGSVYEAISIHNQIAEWPSEVTTHVSSLAASAASFIAMVGDKRTIADNAEFMIHNAWTIAAGNAVDFRAFAGMLEKIDSNLADMYERKSNLSREEVVNLLNGEEGSDGTYLNAQEALDAGFMTEVIDTSRKDRKESKNKPRLMRAKMKLFAIDTNGK